ncbi:MAG: hypothetical protein JXM70_22850 [Pirellulales bacterium]|nr:hypothetical protein [Pirellulales bacterium]
MGRKRKKKPLPPRCKRMKRPGRLQSGKLWLKKYSGKNVLRGYCKHYGVDWRCALIELKQLGIHFDPKYIQQREVTEQQRAKSRKKRRHARSAGEPFESWYDYDYGSPWEAYLAEDYAALHDMECRQKDSNDK